MCGEALLELQRVDDAIALLERATSLDSTNSRRGSRSHAPICRRVTTRPLFRLIEVEFPTIKTEACMCSWRGPTRAVGNADKAAELLARSEQFQRAAQERSAAAGQRTITPPK